MLLIELSLPSALAPRQSTQTRSELLSHGCRICATRLVKYPNPAPRGPLHPKLQIRKQRKHSSARFFAPVFAASFPSRFWDLGIPAEANGSKGSGIVLTM